MYLSECELAEHVICNGEYLPRLAFVLDHVMTACFGVGVLGDGAVAEDVGSW